MLGLMAGPRYGLRRAALPPLVVDVFADATLAVAWPPADRGVRTGCLVLRRFLRKFCARLVADLDRPLDDLILLRCGIVV